MYFFAFPLLLLFASTICASPAHTSIPASARALIESLDIKWERYSVAAYNKFGSQTSKPMAEWSDLGEEVNRYVEPTYPIATCIAKKVDLSTVVPAHDSAPSGDLHSRQLLQVFTEIKNLQTAGMLKYYYVKVEEGKTYIYITMPYPGAVVSQTKLTEEQKKEARDLGMADLKSRHSLVLDPEHNQDKYFGFELNRVFARPFMLRYAKHIAPVPPSRK